YLLRGNFHAEQMEAWGANGEKARRRGDGNWDVDISRLGPDCKGAVIDDQFLLIAHHRLIDEVLDSTSDKRFSQSFRQQLARTNRHQSVWGMARGKVIGPGVEFPFVGVSQFATLEIGATAIHDLEFYLEAQYDDALSAAALQALLQLRSAKVRERVGAELWDETFESSVHGSRYDLQGRVNVETLQLLTQ
ncbi:MAG: hypothetical protein KDA84_27255, partial [Planctomycetaceae bacterium]|nr:hypothetical protein [Planctomycetaceae bacterium]